MSLGNSTAVLTEPSVHGTVTGSPVTGRLAVKVQEVAWDTEVVIVAEPDGPMIRPGSDVSTPTRVFTVVAAAGPAVGTSPATAASTARAQAASRVVRIRVGQAGMAASSPPQRTGGGGVPGTLPVGPLPSSAGVGARHAARASDGRRRTHGADATPTLTPVVPRPPDPV